jgi:hypothetical protein
MSLSSINIAADTSGAPAGRYVAAEVAEKLEQSLSKLVWHVLYGKPIDASGLAVTAEQLLGELKAPKAAVAA